MITLDSLTQNTVLSIGKQLENNSTDFIFNAETWLNQFPDGIIALLIRRAEEEDFYVANTGINFVNKTVSWMITAYDTEIPGYNLAEFQLISDGAVRKSATFKIYVTTSLYTGQAPHETPAPQWVEDYLSEFTALHSGTVQAQEVASIAADRAEEARERAQEEADRAKDEADRAESAATGIIEQAEEAAERAAESAQQAQAQATIATNQANRANNYANYANNYANNASRSASSANTQANRAETYATQASSAASSSYQSASLAETAVTNATAQADRAKDEADRAKDEADRAETAACGTMILGPEEIQKIVADGKAKSTFNIGDVIYIPWTNYTPSTPVVYQFPFVVVHIGDVYDENDVLHTNALWLMAMYAEPEEIVFDAAEDTVVNLANEPNALEGWYYWGLTGTADYTALNLNVGDPIPTTYDSVHKCGINNLSVLRYGYNRWKDSAYRQWLNSMAAKNENWWTSQHFGDVAPTATYTNKPGWLFGFENRWLDVIKPVKVQTACNTVTDGGVTDVTYDRFFLPSLEQMYGVPQAPGVEGEYWEYWKEETGLDAPSNGSSGDPNDARKIPSVVNYPRGSAVSCRLRSVYRGSADYVWYVNAGGYLRAISAATAYRALPACVIY